MSTSLFSKRAALVLHWVLTTGQRIGAFHQKAIVESTGLSGGLVQKVVAELVRLGFLEQKGIRTGKTYYLTKPKELIAEWVKHYDITKKCRIWTYIGPDFNDDEIDEILNAHLGVSVTWALHASARRLGVGVLNTLTHELYLLNPLVRESLEKALYLEVSERSHQYCFIEPYYSLIAKQQSERLGQGLNKVTPLILTYLDLYHYPMRGREAAEGMAFRLPFNQSSDRKLMNSPEKLVQQDIQALEALVRSLKPWSSDIVYTGGFALLIYWHYFKKNKIKPVATVDIDAILPRKVNDRTKDLATQTIWKILEDAKFEVKFKDINNPPTESYQFEMADRKYEVEFLTTTKARRDREKNVKISGITAQPLNYLDLSLSRKKVFETSDGMQAYVVAPEAWLFHKGLTFPRRGRGSSKYYKDLYGIWYLATCLDDFSEETLINLQELKQKYVSWARKFNANLKRIEYTFDADSWKNLEAQDPSGQLKRANFRRLIDQLI